MTNPVTKEMPAIEGVKMFVEIAVGGDFLIVNDKKDLLDGGTCMPREHALALAEFILLNMRYVDA